MGEGDNERLVEAILAAMDMQTESFADKWWLERGAPQQLQGVREISVIPSHQSSDDQSRER